MESWLGFGCLGQAAGKRVESYICMTNNGVVQEASAEIQVKIKCEFDYLLIDYQKEEMGTFLGYSQLRHLNSLQLERVTLHLHFPK